MAREDSTRIHVARGYVGSTETPDTKQPTHARKRPSLLFFHPLFFLREGIPYLRIRSTIDLIRILL